MRLKKIKKLMVNGKPFTIKWTKKHNGGCFSYEKSLIEIGTLDPTEEETFSVICHELMEITAIEHCVRLKRPDCDSDYIFMYDHRQHTAMMFLFTSLISQFIK